MAPHCHNWYMVGPGRAGGGEELGGLRAVKHYMQRTAVQGSPTMLAAISKQWVRGAKVEEDRIHPFRKYFEELQPVRQPVDSPPHNDRGRYC